MDESLTPNESCLNWGGDYTTTMSLIDFISNNLMVSFQRKLKGIH